MYSFFISPCRNLYPAYFLFNACLIYLTHCHYRTFLHIFKVVQKVIFFTFERKRFHFAKSCKPFPFRVFFAKKRTVFVSPSPCLKSFFDLFDHFIILFLGQECLSGIHCEYTAPFITVLVFRNQMNMQMASCITVCAIVDLVR